MNNFSENFFDLMKSIDKSKNRLEIITDKNGNVRKVWKQIDTGKSKEAGVNAGKAYERSGKRHTSFNGFDTGEIVQFTAGGKEIKGIFKHVNESKHSTVAVIRGDDGKLYERGLSKFSKVTTIVKDPTKATKTPKKTVVPKSPEPSLKEVSKKPLKTSGNNENRSFTEVYKTDWQRGDSVTFTSKTGQQLVGRVMKVDGVINMTTIRLASGMVETVSNKKVIK